MSIVFKDTGLPEFYFRIALYLAAFFQLTITSFSLKASEEHDATNTMLQDLSCVSRWMSGAIFQLGEYF